MKILKIESINGGYAGISTKEFKKFHRFRITDSSQLIIPIRVSDQVDSYKSFLDIWQKIEPDSKFIVPPVEVEELSLAALNRSMMKAA